MTVWTRPVIRELRRLHGKGHSCAIIAAALNERFGCAVTRSAVGAKAIRLGLSDPERRPGAASMPLTLGDVAEAQALAMQGMDVADIAARLGTTRKRVEAALAGEVSAVAEFTAPRAVVQEIALTDGEVAQAERLLDLGVPIGEVADTMTATVAHVEWAVRRARDDRARNAARAARAAERAMEDEIARRELHTVPATAPSMKDLLRVPLRVKTGGQ